MACLITGATVSLVIPRSAQYADCGQTESCFCPLLALQPQQHSAIFSRLMMDSSLMMCSQLAADFFDTLDYVNGALQ